MNALTLRPLSLADTHNIVRWRNLPSVRKNLYSQKELTPEQHISYYKNVVQCGKCAQFIISVKEEEASTDIGTVFIKNIDYDNKSGEYGIFIGEESARGKGYAKLATSQILAYGFESLMLNRIFLTVMADNMPAIKAYESAGFIHEGVMREMYLRADRYVDVIMMAITRNDWDKREG